MTPEEDAFRAELHTPIGAEGSGRRRYAAAMALHRAGRLPDAALEVYRICSPRDHEDPSALLERRGLLSQVPAPVAPGPHLAASRLLDEADRYLAGLDGPGIAEVRAGLSRWRGAGPQPVAAASNPVRDRWLAPALERVAENRPALAQAIGQAAPHLKWITYDAYPPEKIGASFRTGHAFASIVGEVDAPYTSRDFDFGLFLIAPQVLYRDHRHAAPELYAPLTGPHGWRFGTSAPLAVLPAHVPVWNEPFRPHLTKVGTVPFLCLFGWTSDVSAPAEVLPAEDWDALEALPLDAVET